MKTLVIVALACALLAFPNLAFAGCTTTLVDGKVWCTTCCYGGSCTTSCN